MGATSVALCSLTSRSGLRRTLVAYALFGLVEIAIWLAINLAARLQPDRTGDGLRQRLVRART